MKIALDKEQISLGVRDSFRRIVDNLLWDQDQRPPPIRWRLRAPLLTVAPTIHAMEILYRHDQDYTVEVSNYASPNCEVQAYVSPRWRRRRMINCFAGSGEDVFSHRQVQKGLPSNCHYPRLRVTSPYDLPKNLSIDCNCVQDYILISIY